MPSNDVSSYDSAMQYQAVVSGLALAQELHPLLRTACSPTTGGQNPRTFGWNLVSPGLLDTTMPSKEL
jgi:hypothetical protein